jgi:hypothetical protein
MQLVPLDAVPSQRFTISLSNQACQIELYQKVQGLFMNVSVNDELIIGGVICLNQVRIVRDLYLGFLGDFFFNDSQGSSDPYYTGLGSRFQLVYVPPEELPEGVG